MYTCVLPSRLNPRPSDPNSGVPTMRQTFIPVRQRVDGSPHRSPVGYKINTKKKTKKVRTLVQVSVNRLDLRTDGPHRTPRQRVRVVYRYTKGATGPQHKRSPPGTTTKSPDLVPVRLRTNHTPRKVGPPPLPVLRQIAQLYPCFD